MRKTINVDANPTVGVISAPTRLCASVIWAARRALGTTLNSDSTSYDLGTEDQAILAEAIRFRRWWLFAGGAFHFSISDLPISTVLSLAMSRRGELVMEAPEAVKFRAAVSPIGMANSAVFTLSSVIERLIKLHGDLQDGGLPAYQLLELLPLGAAVDVEYLIPASDLLSLAESVVMRNDTARGDSMLCEIIWSLLGCASDVCPDIFIPVKEMFCGKKTVLD